MACYGSRKEFVERCKNYSCLDLDCGSVHTYKYCFMFQNTTCRNEKCQFLHCTSVEQLQYETTGKPTEHLKREVARTLQNTNICGDFKTSVCNRTKCKRRHIKLDNSEPLECPICTKAIIIENFGAGDCGHIFCCKCASRIVNETNDEMKVQCPICRFTGEYKKLM
ncbi:PREDICTED: uncharacterized protein LOC105557345 [Vollenhovia emeryi]|uniref:uncharacterized protein LOC105557345 n=1 Tax=Vollenhovia emeryi TaxID=411798 RepID=UPI0005F5130A|nr:PREDICTED: uncharacterized protein LOC105557345 [Vollenhovia emeryi]